MKRKHERRSAILGRARNAILDLYHNATVVHPYVVEGEYWEWFYGQSELEISYINDGGAHGRDYRSCLRSNGERKYRSKAAINYYVVKGMRDMRAERDRYAKWEYITEYGHVYQFGRGGRTLAPDHLVSSRGNPIEDCADDMNLESLTEFIQIIESFNAYVESWCKGVTALWDEHLRDQQDEADYESEQAAKWAVHNLRTA